MKVAIVGTGYVGLPSGIGFAELNNKVICIDKDQTKINNLQNGILTLYEDGLEKLFLKNIQNGRLEFTTSIKEGVLNADVVILAVGTPPHPKTKEADLRYIYQAAEELAPFINKYMVIANKSTVSVGTGDEVEKIIKKVNPKANFDVVSLPEFLREGFALHDFFNPDRIVIGTESLKAKKILEKLYQPFENKTQILYVKRRSSEALKYASNAFLAMKIHYINEMADFCEKAGADIREVSYGMGLDKRIGNKFLNAGPGFGGSCFPKDTLAMALMAEKYGVDMSLIKTTIKGNIERKKRIADRILKVVQNIQNPKIGILGLAFKNGTDDVRESPSMEIISHLLAHNVSIIAYDPKALENAKKILKDQISYTSNIKDVFRKTDVVVILTEWPEFKDIDYKKSASLMKQKIIIDCRNLLNLKKLKEEGIKYIGIGY